MHPQAGCCTSQQSWRTLPKQKFLRVATLILLLCRHGRLGQVLYVPLPDAPGRASILQALARKRPISSDVDLAGVAAQCSGFSGADLAALLQQACVCALKVQPASVHSS